MCEKCVIDEDDSSMLVELVFDEDGNEVIDRKCRCPCSTEMLDIEDPPYDTDEIFGVYTRESVMLACENCRHGVE